MNERKFWMIIDKIKDSGLPEISLQKELMKLPAEELVDFQNNLLIFAQNLNHTNFQDVYKKKHGYFSHDGYDYLCFGVVGRGEDLYFEVLGDPECILKQEREIEEGEMLKYVAGQNNRPVVDKILLY